MSVAGWTASPGLPGRVATRIAPRGILLSHWDNFLRPMRLPARVLPGIQLSEALNDQVDF
jgi:hypothetical protein